MNFKHTYRIVVTLTKESDNPDGSNFDEDAFRKRLPKFATVDFKRVGVSPNRISFECPTEGCSLRWLHRVGQDDPELTPQTCIYCKRKGERIIAQANSGEERLDAEEKALALAEAKLLLEVPLFQVKAYTI